MRRLFLLLAICYACSFSKEKKDDEHMVAQEHATQKLDEHETETKQTGPETITTTVEEYEMPQGSPLAGDTAPNRVLPISGLADARPTMFPADARKMPPAAVMVKRTVIVDQRGPVVATKTREAEETGAEDVGLDMTRHTEMASKTSPALAGWLWMALAAAAVVGGGWLAWKFSLPGKLLALIRGA